jgi:NAD+ kinase
MNIKNCVLVIKETALAQSSLAEKLARRGDMTARGLVHAHDEHHRTVEAVREALGERGIDFAETTPRLFSERVKRKIASSDLTVSVGGDGTALASSHYVREGLMIGVNSAPRDSVGHFCSTDRRGFTKTLDGILDASLKPLRLARLAVSLDDRPLPELALNDVLIAHALPAATTRYIIQIGGESEEHRSSGVWVSTAAGSTAGIRSAGGKVMPPRSRRFQYLVRELYRQAGKSYKLKRGILESGMRLIIASKMPEGRLYLDGSRTTYDFPFGTRAKIEVSPFDLKLFLKPRR